MEGTCRLAVCNAYGVSHYMLDKAASKVYILSGIVDVVDSFDMTLG